MVFVSTATKSRTSIADLLASPTSKSITSFFYLMMGLTEPGMLLRFVQTATEDVTMLTIVNRSTNRYTTRSKKYIDLSNNYYPISRSNHQHRTPTNLPFGNTSPSERIPRRQRMRRWPEGLPVPTPRHTIVDESTPGLYHVISRCVRRAYLGCFGCFPRPSIETVLDLPYEAISNWTCAASGRK